MPTREQLTFRGFAANLLGVETGARSLAVSDGQKEAVRRRMIMERSGRHAGLTNKRFANRRVLNPLTSYDGDTV
jgi:hypothetical protein